MLFFKTFRYRHIISQCQCVYFIDIMYEIFQIFYSIQMTYRFFQSEGTMKYTNGRFPKRKAETTDVYTSDSQMESRSSILEQE